MAPNPYFFLAVLLFAANQMIEAAGIVVPALHSYLDDLLCLPIVLAIVLGVQRKVIVRDADYLLPASHTLFAVALYGLLFEVLLPYFFQRGTADALDWLLYAAGGVLFHTQINRQPGRKKSHSDHAEVAF